MRLENEAKQAEV